jgi:hypothetical protein
VLALTIEKGDVGWKSASAFHHTPGSNTTGDAARRWKTLRFSTLRDSAQHGIYSEICE